MRRGTQVFGCSDHVEEPNKSLVHAAFSPEVLPDDMPDGRRKEAAKILCTEVQAAHVDQIKDEVELRFATCEQALPSWLRSIPSNERRRNLHAKRVGG